MSDPVVALYRSLSTSSLLDLRTAFQLDAQSVVDRDQESQAFIAGRLAVIAAELKSRGHVELPRETSDSVGPVGLSDPVAP